MSRNQQHTIATEKTADTQNNMEYLQLNTLTAELVEDKSETGLSHVSGKWWNLTLWQSQEHNWDAGRDFYVKDRVPAEQVLRAVLRYVAGDFNGSAKLVVVAPPAKLANSFGTGTFAYVRSDFVSGSDAVILDVDGAEVLFDVPQTLVPAYGWARLHLVPGGGLTRNAWEEDITADNPKTFKSFWTVTAASALLSGINVSVGVGPNLLELAKQVAAGIANPEQAGEINGAVQFARREERRFSREIGENLAEEQFAQEVLGQAPSTEANDFVVPLFNGGTVSLQNWPVNKSVFLKDSVGNDLRYRNVGTGTVAERLALAATIRSRGYLVNLLDRS